jgi:hypothetical protein
VRVPADWQGLVFMSAERSLAELAWDRLQLAVQPRQMVPSVETSSKART